MNIYDIAEKCGVSIATVSRVLNNNPKVRPQTREKVLAVIEQEHYSPSALARGLGSGSLQQVGILCGDSHAAFHSEAVSRIEEGLWEKGYTPLLCCTGTDIEQQTAGASALLKQGVAAILLVGMAAAADSAAFLADIARKVPVVVFDGHLSAKGTYSLYCNEKEAFSQQISELYSRLRRQVLLLYTGDSYACRQKIAGYRAGYEALGVEPSSQLIVPVERSTEAVNVCIKRLLVQRVTFDAILATEDLLALGAQKALQRIGISMPIIGCHNTLLAQCSTPELTSIDTGTEQLCAAAVDTVCRLLEGQAVSAEAVFPATLVERDSFRRN